MHGILPTPSTEENYNACDYGNILYSANTQYIACGALIGFDPSSKRVDAFTLCPESDVWRAMLSELSAGAFLTCAQRDTACNCNWMLPAESADTNCASCQLTLLIPQLEIPENVKLWHKAEVAKRRELIQHLRLGLPVASINVTPLGLGFKFMASLPGKTILTGYEDRFITLNISEADDSEPHYTTN